MIDIPEWLEGHLKEIECPNCGRVLQKAAISGIGVKEYTDKKKKNNRDNKFLFIEHTCQSCGKTYGFDVALCDVKDFVVSMIEKYNGKMDGTKKSEFSYNKDDVDEDDEYLEEDREEFKDDIFPKVDEKNEIKKAPKKIEAVKKSPVAGITDSDVAYAKKIINECNTYDDLLKVMGITSEDMARYNGHEQK